MGDPSPERIPANVDRESFARSTSPMRTATLALVQFHEHERETRHHEPVIGSPAAMEDLLAGQFVAIQQNACREPRLLASIMLSTAGELIRSVALLHATPDHPVLIADRVLTRSVLEHCGRALWLLDPTIDARTRVARGVMEQLEDLRLQRLLVSDDEDRTKAFQQSIEELSSKATAAGFIVRHNSKSASTIDRERRPRPTDAVMASLGSASESVGRIAQRSLSLAVHGNPISMLMHRDADGEHVDLGGGLVGAPFVMRSDHVNMLIGQCAIAYSGAVQSYRDLMGWEDRRWDQLRRELATVWRRQNSS